MRDHLDMGVTNPKHSIEKVPADVAEVFFVDRLAELIFEQLLDGDPTQSREQRSSASPLE